MLHVVLALAPLMSVGSSQASHGGMRLNGVDILREFKYALLNAQPNPNGEPPDPPDFPAVLGGGTWSNYCLSNPHTFGGPADIKHMGSLDLSLQTFGLKTTALPPISASFGMYTYGSAPFPSVPFANGFLCVSPFGPFFRMRMQPLTATGIVQNSMAVTPLEYTQFTPGSQWYFQFWYRNAQAGGAKFNLSNALDIVFAP